MRPIVGSTPPVPGPSLRVRVRIRVRVVTLARPFASGMSMSHRTTSFVSKSNSYNINNSNDSNMTHPMLPQNLTAANNSEHPSSTVLILCLSDTLPPPATLPFYPPDYVPLRYNAAGGRRHSSHSGLSNPESSTLRPCYLSKCSELVPSGVLQASKANEAANRKKCCLLVSALPVATPPHSCDHHSHQCDGT